MATIKDTAATSALNEDKYINKLYGSSGDAQKKMLEENYTANTRELDEAKKQVQQQTQTNIQRTNAESKLMAQGYGQRPVSYGGSQQAGLSQWNQRQADNNALIGKQNDADYEIERQRTLLGQQYAAEIKRAQAANDMEKAQALYDAAKAEDAQLEAATLMAGMGDNTIMESLQNGELPQRDTTTETWDGILRNEDSINAIYNAKQEAAAQEAKSAYMAKLSDLMAQQRQQEQKTDQSLTQAYVEALRKGRNYQETQGAYGQGSGTAAKAALARDMELQKRLTELRGVQAASAVQSGVTGAGYGADMRAAIAKSLENTNSERNKALIDAAEKEEQTMVDLQRFTGDAAAKNNDYSILGKLYGLTQDQVDRLQGTGIYAPEPDVGNATPLELWGKNYRRGSGSSGGGSGGSSGGGSGGSSGSGGGSKSFARTPQDAIWYRNS